MGIIIQILIILIILIITIILLFSISIKSSSLHLQYNINNVIIDDISNIKDNSKTEIIKQENINKDDPYYDFIKMNLIDVDFTELKRKNKDTVGWLQVNGTNINYPFVQTSNNNFYLNHSFNKTINGAGWVFLDYRNNINNLDKNTIIYAHGRLNNTMFGTLRTILKSDWVNNTNNHVIRISTEGENSLWQVFSVYKIPNTSDYLDINFSNNDFKKFTEKLIKRSSYNFNTMVDENDKILTLSTCYDDNNKVVLHAKLIKKMSKS